MKCPVCGKSCHGKVGISSHVFKTKDEAHLEFVRRQNVLVDGAFFRNISCGDLAGSRECHVSVAYICERWQKIPGYKERKSRMNSSRMLGEWKKGQRKVPPSFTNKGAEYDLGKKTTISQKQHDKIVSLFESDKSIAGIAKEVSCDRKTVRSVFLREFGSQKTKSRGKKMASATCLRTVAGKNKVPADSGLGKAIVDSFCGNEGIRSVAKRLGTGTGVVVRIWKHAFGADGYKRRCARMRKIQRERASKSLRVAKFLGSKNERLCHRVLSEKIPGTNVIHHDYSIVCGLEIDISIPEMKVAISWDGPGHRRPVFGRRAFGRTLKNDRRRDHALRSIGWRHISIIDEGRHNPPFVKHAVDLIIGKLGGKWSGKCVIDPRKEEG